MVIDSFSEIVSDKLEGITSELFDESVVDKIAELDAKLLVNGVSDELTLSLLGKSI